MPQQPFPPLVFGIAQAVAQIEARDPVAVACEMYATDEVARLLRTYQRALNLEDLRDLLSRLNAAQLAERIAEVAHVEEEGLLAAHLARVVYAAGIRAPGQLTRRESVEQLDALWESDEDFRTYMRLLPATWVAWYVSEGQISADEVDSLRERLRLGALVTPSVAGTLEQALLLVAPRFGQEPIAELAEDIGVPDFVVQAAHHMLTPGLSGFLHGAPQEVHAELVDPEDPVEEEPVATADGGGSGALGAPGTPPTTDLAEQALELQHLSDGRVWNEVTVVQEITQFHNSMVLNAYEIGRRLLWAKEALPYGQLGAWCEQHFGFSHQMRSLYMKVARVLLDRPKMRQQLLGGNMKSIALLTTFAPEQLDEAESTGLIAGVPLEEISDKPFSEVRDLLGKARKKAEELEQQLQHNDKVRERLADKVKDLEARLANASGLMPPPERDEALSKLLQAHRDFDAGMVAAGVALDELAKGMREADPELRSRFMGLLQYMQVRAEYEALRAMELSGLEDVVGAEFAAVLDRPREARDSYPLPAGRVLRAYGEGDAPPAPAAAPVNGSAQPFAHPTA